MKFFWVYDLSDSKSMLMLLTKKFVDSNNVYLVFIAEICWEEGLDSQTKSVSSMPTFVCHLKFTSEIFCWQLSAYRSSCSQNPTFVRVNFLNAQKVSGNIKSVMPWRISWTIIFFPSSIAVSYPSAAHGSSVRLSLFSESAFATAPCPCSAASESGVSPPPAEEFQAGLPIADCIKQHQKVQLALANSGKASCQHGPGIRRWIVSLVSFCREDQNGYDLALSPTRWRELSKNASEVDVQCLGNKACPRA